LVKGIDLPQEGTAFEMSMSIASYIDVEGSEGYAAVWSAIQKLSPGTRERMEELVVEMWAYVDPPAALASMGQDYSHSETIYRIWAETDPETAFQHSRGARYDSLLEGFAEDVMIGLARKDRTAAVALARREGIEFEPDYFEEWIASEPGGIDAIAAEMIVLGESGALKPADDFRDLVRSLESEDTRVVFDRVLDASGEWRDDVVAVMIERASEGRAEELFTKAVADRDWLGDGVELSELFSAYAGADSGAAAEWFRGLDPDDPLRGELAVEAIDRGFHRDAMEAAALLDSLPEGQRAESLYEIAAYPLFDAESGIDARMAWVEQWKMELGPVGFGRAVEEHLTSAGSDEMIRTLEHARRYGKEGETLRHFAYSNPEDATPMILEELPVGERGEYLVVAFENLLEDAPEQALELFPTLTHASDIQALSRGISEASVPEETRAAALEILEGLNP
jgi:hypothetical protein